MIFLFSAKAQDASLGDAVNGKKLFKKECASCHKLNGKLIGPGLFKVTDKRDLDWLKKWIKNNSKLRKSGDKDAIAIFEEYNGSLMQSFEYLSDKDIMDILEYTNVGDPKKVASAGTGAEQTIKNDEGGYLNLIFVVLFFFLLLIFLAKVKNILKKISKEPTSSLIEDLSNFSKKYIRDRTQVKAILITVIILFLLTNAWNWLMQIGIDKGYQPIQPIAFSHKVHSGDNKIDCKYCHFGVRKGKWAGIPSVNVCMNCHKFISEGSLYGKEEIQKIYDAIGFDAEKSEYIENYKQKPIKWIRIHKLPDFAYFNHSQHVEVGKLECAECHGPIEEMDEVYQYSDLTMGWCIDCHIKKEIDLKSSDYYKMVHQQLSKKYNVEKLTVAMMGGIECAKCHY